MHAVTDDGLNFSGFSVVGQLPTKGRQLRLGNSWGIWDSESLLFDRRRVVVVVGGGARARQI